MLSMTDDVYGEGVLTVRQCQNWFAKFRPGNFDVEDALRSGRPVEADKDAIKALVDANRRITTREIGERLNLLNSTFYGNLKDKLSFIFPKKKEMTFRTTQYKNYYEEMHYCTKEDSDDNFDSHTLFNLCAFFMKSLSLYAQSLVRRINHIIMRFIENFQLVELFDRISDKLVEYPPLRFVVLAAALSCAIPVVMFVIFGVTSVLITFAGFLFIEGTLLAVGGLCMFICIATLVLVLSILAVTLGAFYILAGKLGLVLSRFEATSNILKTVAPSTGGIHSTERSNGVIHPHQN